ncbi:MAG TPA: nitronate monooxygenase [Solirubrobacteraceae bacterium]|nr:nitronate monooxygenase [Solirubrobacteraceae bacterium]
MSLLERLGLELPIVQAGLGGGLSGAELAAAVSRAGGLGTVGIFSPVRFVAELRRARALSPGRPLAANLLMPFVRPAHVAALISAEVDVAIFFYGFNRAAVERLHAAGVLVLHQVGNEAQARRALADGADGLIAQGLQAGGHLLAELDTFAFLPRACALAEGKPVLAAGGIHDAQGVRRALAAGAAGVLCGTRFLLTEECAAHPLYKQRVLGAERTIETLLFSFGWYARHRVAPNASTDRWCAARAAGPRAVALMNRLSGPLGRRMPLSLPAARLQLRSLPLYSPAPALAGMPDRVVDVTPLYAGESARAIHEILPAAEAVAELSRGVGS